jgi:hypothetical protein
MEPCTHFRCRARDGLTQRNFIADGNDWNRSAARMLIERQNGVSW